jgi:signal transduction histidine kinase
VSEIDAHLLIPLRWRSALRWSRLVLAATAAGTALLAAGSSSGLKPALLLTYLIYAAVLAISPKQQRLDRTLPGYLIDSAYFLVLASLPGPWMAALSGLSFLLAAVRAMLYHPPGEVLSVGAGTWLAFVLIRPAELPRLGAALALGVVLTVTACRQRETLVGRLLEASRQALLYRQESEKAREAERERLAADFHDGPLQSFASFQIRLEIVRKLMERDPAAAMHELRRLQEFGQSQLEEIRAFVRQMRPVQVDGVAFSSAVRRLVENFERESGIRASFESPEPVELPDADVSRELLKVVREALHNAFKHARPSRVSVRVARSDGAVEIAVSDDGAGFPFSGRYGLAELDSLGLGPESIKQRIRALGGELTVESRPGQGAEVRVRVRA